MVGPAGAVVGVDASPQMLAVAAKRCARFPNVAFHEGDATALPVEEASFDAALCVQVLEYVADATAALAQMHRALRPRRARGGVGRRLGHRQLALRGPRAHGARPGAPGTSTSRTRRCRARWRRAAGRGLPRRRRRGPRFTTTELDPEAMGTGVVLASSSSTSPAAPASARRRPRRGPPSSATLGERGELYFSFTQFCFTAARAG